MKYPRINEDPRVFLCFEIGLKASYKLPKKAKWSFLLNAVSGKIQSSVLRCFYDLARYIGGIRHRFHPAFQEAGCKSAIEKRHSIGIY